MTPASHLHEDIDGLLSRIAELDRTLQAAEQRQQWRLDLAARIHRSLLPAAVRHDRILLDVRYRSIEEVGGDYCQICMPDDQTCYVTMYDVTAHGVGATLLATRIRGEVHDAMVKKRAPVEIVRMLNEFLDDHFRESHLYLTFFAARIDLNEHRITYCGAGYPSPLLIRRATGEIEPLASQNPIVGVARDALEDEPQHTIEIEAGDRLLFYSDGISETENAAHKQLGVVGLARLLLETIDRDLFETLDTILQEIDAYQSGPDTDDKTLLMAEFR